MNESDGNQAFYTYIGQRIRERRRLLKLSQSQLAELIGFSYQQIQKYETGASQASISRLLQFARIMNVPLSYFYEGAKLEDDVGVSITSDIIQRSRTAPLRALLIEDSPADVILFRKALAATPEQVDLHVIHDSENVMFYLQNHKDHFGKESPDLVILDLSLPKIGGLQLLKMIKSNTETVRLPVIILTNSISRKEMSEAYRFGAAGFIQKSVDLEEYIDSVESAIRYWARTVALPAA